MHMHTLTQPCVCWTPSGCWFVMLHSVSLITISIVFAPAPCSGCSVMLQIISQVKILVEGLCELHNLPPAKGLSVLEQALEEKVQCSAVIQRIKSPIWVTPLHNHSDLSWVLLYLLMCFLYLNFLSLLAWLPVCLSFPLLTLPLSPYL